MEELSRVEKRVNHIEYEEIKQIKKDIEVIRIDLTRNNILVQQSIDTSGKLSDTMESIRETMLLMSKSMEQNNLVSERLASSVEELGTKFNELDTKVDTRFIDVDKKLQCQEDKSKIDIICFLKDNWFKIIISASIISYIVLGGVGM